MNDTSALHRYRAKAQAPRDLASIEMLRLHMIAITTQESELNRLAEAAELMTETTFISQSFENFSRKKDVAALRENFKNLVNHVARKERDAQLAKAYTDRLRTRNTEAAAQLQRTKNEREYWRQMVKALHDTDAARQDSHTDLDRKHRELKIEIQSIRATLEKRLAAKATLKSHIAELQLRLLEQQSLKSSFSQTVNIS